MTPDPSSAARGRGRGEDAIAVIFDMDGVLIDSGAHHRAAWRALLAEIGEEPDPEHWRLTIGRPSEEAVPLLLGRRLSDYEVRRLARRKRDLYVDFARQGIVTVAGVSRFIADLARQKVPRAVGTSASGFDVYHLLGDAGLRRYFDVIVTADDVAYGKPDPEVYLLAAARLRVAPERCVVFEDSLVGVEAARRAGMRAIGITTAHTIEELIHAGVERAVADFEEVEWPAIAHP
jgi:beta-phosphoglucomutase-like phosphatase (HAD superfamily)